MNFAKSNYEKCKKLKIKYIYFELILTVNIEKFNKNDLISTILHALSRVQP